MKKILLTAVILMICVGCQVKQDDIILKDPLRFKEEYSMLDLKDDNPVEYIESGDVEYQLTHGTHAVFFGDSDSEMSQTVARYLIDAAQQYSGMIIYYMDIDEVESSDEYQQIVQKYNLQQPVVAFIKNGEMMFYYCDPITEEHLNMFKDHFEALVSDVNPGCATKC